MSADRHIRKTSKAGLALIVSREGVRLKTYRDSRGIPTIGVGHTQGVKVGQKISLVQAYRFLAADVRSVEAVLNKLDIPDQRMYDALVSFGFNLGPGYFQPSFSMGHALHHRLWSSAASAFDNYHTPPEIVGRRNSEKAQFQRGLAALRKRQKRK